MVKLFHRVLGYRDGALVIRKKDGVVVAVELDGRLLDPSEWEGGQMFHVEQSSQPVQKVFTDSRPRG